MAYFTDLATSIVLGESNASLKFARPTTPVYDFDLVEVRTRLVTVGFPDADGDGRFNNLDNDHLGFE